MSSYKVTTRAHELGRRQIPTRRSHPVAGSKSGSKAALRKVPSRIIDVTYEDHGIVTPGGLSRFFGVGSSGSVQLIKTEEQGAVLNYADKLLRVFDSILSKDAKRKIRSLHKNMNPEDEVGLQTLYINLCSYVQDRDQNQLAYVAVLRELYRLGLNYYEDAKGYPHIVREEEFEQVSVFQVDESDEPVSLSGVPLASVKESLHAREAQAIRLSVEEGTLGELVDVVFYRDGVFINPDQMIDAWEGVFTHLSVEERVQIVSHFKSADDVVQMIEAVFDPSVYDRLVHVRLLSLLAALPNLEEVLEHTLITLPHLGVNLICLSQVELKHQTNMAFYNAYSQIAKRHNGWSEDLMEFLTGHGSFGGRRLADGFVVQSHSDAHDLYLQALSLISSGNSADTLEGIRFLERLGVHAKAPYVLKENMAVLLLSLSGQELEAQEVREAASEALKKYKGQIVGEVGDAVAHAVGATAWMSAQIARATFFKGTGRKKLKQWTEEGREYSRDAFKGYVKVLSASVKGPPNDHIDMTRLNLPQMSYIGVVLPKTLMTVEQFVILKRGGAQFTNVILWNFTDTNPIHLIPNDYDYKIVVLGGQYTGAEFLALIQKRVDFNLDHKFSIHYTPEELSEFEEELDDFIAQFGPKAAFYFAAGLKGAQLSDAAKKKIATSFLSDDELVDRGVLWLKAIGDESCVQQLRALSFEDPRESVRIQAFNALCELQDRAALATQMALDELHEQKSHTYQEKDGSEATLYSGVVRLNDSKDHRALPFLRKAFNKSSHVCYVQAAGVLDCDGSRDWLPRLMTSTNKDIRLAALKGLGTIGKADEGERLAYILLNMKVMEKIFTDSEQSVMVQSLAQILRRDPSPELQEKVLTLLKDNKGGLLLLEALGELGDVEAAKYLFEIGGSGASKDYRNVAANAYLKIVARYDLKDDFAGVESFLNQAFADDVRLLAIQTIQILGARYPQEAATILEKAINLGDPVILIPAIKAYAEVVAETPFHNWTSLLNRLDKNLLTPEVMQAGCDSVMRIVERFDLSGDAGFSAIIGLGYQRKLFLTNNAEGYRIKVQMLHKMILRSIQRGETDIFHKPHFMTVSALKSKSESVQVETAHLLFDLYRQLPDDLKKHVTYALIELAVSQDDYPHVTSEGFAHTVEYLSMMGCADQAYEVSRVLRSKFPEQFSRLRQAVLNMVHHDTEIDEKERGMKVEWIERDFAWFSISRA